MSIPSLFISHGAPTMALEKTGTAAFLKGLAKTLPKPRAIVVASAHWTTHQPMITGAAHPPMIYDFQGFPEELYKLRYLAPGDPALASNIQTLLHKAGFNATIDSARGLDHGAWVPLYLSYPDAAIPVLQVSVQPQNDARWHYKIGQALTPLRNDNILVIGSGNLTHNLREAFLGHHDATPAWVSDFSTWVHERFAVGDVESLLDWQEKAPHAHENHPTTEHFLPLFVALGAGGKDAHATQLYSGITMGVLEMDAYAFG